MNLNKAQIIGRVTRDPEVRNTPSGSAVATFSVATNYKYKGAKGPVENVSFHNCVAFGKLASEVIAKYCVKGQEVYVGGRLDYQEWIKQDGTKGTKTQIIVEDFQLGSKPVGATNKKENDYSQPAPVDDGSQDIEFPITGDEEEINVENIPF